MSNAAIATLTRSFESIHDPRNQNSIDHLMLDILMLTVFAVICGAESWVDVHNYGVAKQEWLKKFLSLPNGIPSHDTIERLFARLRPEQLQGCFLSWVQEAFEISGGQLIAVDGKTLRSSYERGGKKGMIHMVSAGATQNRLVLGQRKVAEKSNEITAIPQLLKLLELEGATVSIDAMGCQFQIASQIVEQGGDYVLALKGNQGNLWEDAKQLFTQAFEQEFRSTEYDVYETQQKAHGRIETRRYWVMGNAEYLIGAEKWPNLQTIGCVESSREVDGHPPKIERRYYVLSLPLDASRFAAAVRGHWGIENQLHWILDVAFREDQARSISGYAGENLAVIRHIAINLLSHEKSAKGGIQARRRKAGWDERYLEQIFSHAFKPTPRM